MEIPTERCEPDRDRATGGRSPLRGKRRGRVGGTPLPPAVRIPEKIRACRITGVPDRTQH